MKYVPLCHKCASAIKEFITFNCWELVGCKECDAISSYADAEKLCPILKEVSDDS